MQPEAGRPVAGRSRPPGMGAAALSAFQDLFTPPFRAVLAKTLGLTVVLLALAWLALQWALSAMVALPNAWMDTALALVAGIGVLIGMIFLVPPISTLVAGLFLDDIAETVERTRYPHDAPGRALPLSQAMPLAARFFGLVLLVNLVAMLLLLVPGINLVAFLGANAFLLAREYFQLIALRHGGQAEMRALRARHGGRLFLAGLIIAALMAVPIVNLVAPLFGTAFMVHVYKRLAPPLQAPSGRTGAAMERSSPRA